MQRITEKDLQGLIDRINIATGMPVEKHRKTATGWAHNPGNYHLSGAYGGVNLCRTSLKPDCSGTSDVFPYGHIPKRELYRHLVAFLSGLEAGNKH